MASADSRVIYARVYSDAPRTSNDAQGAIELRLIEPAGKSPGGSIKNVRTKARTALSSWLGVAALVTITLLSAAAIGVLLGSNGSPVDQ